MFPRGGGALTPLTALDKSRDETALELVKLTRRRLADLAISENYVRDEIVAFRNHIKSDNVQEISCRSGETRSLATPSAQAQAAIGSCSNSPLRDALFCEPEAGGNPADILPDSVRGPQ